MKILPAIDISSMNATMIKNLLAYYDLDITYASNQIEFGKTGAAGVQYGLVTLNFPNSLIINRDNSKLTLKWRVKFDDVADNGSILAVGFKNHDGDSNIEKFFGAGISNGQSAYIFNGFNRAGAYSLTLTRSGNALSSGTWYDIEIEFQSFLPNDPDGYNKWIGWLKITVNDIVIYNNKFGPTHLSNFGPMFPSMAVYLSAAITSATYKIYPGKLEVSEVVGGF